MGKVFNPLMKVDNLNEISIDTLRSMTDSEISDGLRCFCAVKLKLTDESLESVSIINLLRLLTREGLDVRYDHYGFLPSSAKDAVKVGVEPPLQRSSKMSSAISVLSRKRISKAYM